MKECFKTKHNVSGIMYACTGDGFMTKNWRTTKYEPPEILSDLEKELMRTLGVDSKAIMKPDVFYQPLAPLKICSCRYKGGVQSHISDAYFKPWQNHELYTWQIKAFQDYLKKGNIYIHGTKGGGKSWLAQYICRKPISKNLEIFNDKKFREHLVKLSREGEPFNPNNKLIVLEDIDKCSSSDFFNDEFFSLVNQMDMQKCNIIMTSNFPIDELCDKFTTNDKTKEALIKRMFSNMVEVEVK